MEAPLLMVPTRTSTFSLRTNSLAMLRAMSTLNLLIAGDEHDLAAEHPLLVDFVQRQLEAVEGVVAEDGRRAAVGVNDPDLDVTGIGHGRKKQRCGGDHPRHQNQADTEDVFRFHKDPPCFVRIGGAPLVKHSRAEDARAGRPPLEIINVS